MRSRRLPSPASPPRTRTGPTSSFAAPSSISTRSDSFERTLQAWLANLDFAQVEQGETRVHGGFARELDGVADHAGRAGSRPCRRRQAALRHRAQRRRCAGDAGGAAPARGRRAGARGHRVLGTAGRRPAVRRDLPAAADPAGAPARPDPASAAAAQPRPGARPRPDRSADRRHGLAGTRRCGKYRWPGPSMSMPASCCTTMARRRSTACRRATICAGSARCCARSWRPTCCGAGEPPDAAAYRATLCPRWATPVPARLMDGVRLPATLAQILRQARQRRLDFLLDHHIDGALAFVEPDRAPRTLSVLSSTTAAALIATALRA